MGFLGNVIKGAATTAAIRAGTSIGTNLAKNYFTGNMKMPDLNLGSAAGAISLPFGLDAYIAKPVRDAASKLNIQMPSSINGVSLPSLPDFSSVSGEVEGMLSNMNFSPEKLGLRSVSEILANPDINAMKEVQWASPVNLNDMPDVNKLMDGIDLTNLGINVNSLDSIESTINTVKSNPSLSSISKITGLF